MSNDFASFAAAWRGKRVAVIGAGISNLPLAELLLRAGARVTLRDKKSRGELGLFRGRPAADYMEEAGAVLCLGEGYLDALTEEVIFKSPGMRFDHPALAAAVASGARLTSEMSLFFSLCPAKIIGITGSDGKTTTTTLIAEILEAAGKKVFLGGNIGKPLLPEVFDMTPEDFSVVELSSFQLHIMRASPAVAVVTNLSPNHLDYHKDMAEYADAKANILRYQRPGDRAVLNYASEAVRSMAALTPAEVSFFSGCEMPGVKPKAPLTVYEKEGVIFYQDEAILSVADIRLPGRHNVENYMAAIGALYGTVPKEAFVTVAKSFGGVEHRLEWVRTLDGVKYYNSSIDSSPTRTIAALSAFGEQKLTLLMGGYDKHIPYDILGDPVCRSAKRVILTGATADAIERAIRASSLYREGAPALYRADDYGAAVRLARKLSLPGDIVLLTPASASFDAFKNFEERGRFFKAAVHALT